MADQLSEKEKLASKIKEIKNKKGDVDPVIIIYRENNKPFKIVLKSVEPPVIEDNYVSISVSNSDFIKIVRTIQQIDESEINKSRHFDCCEGGRSFSRMEYYNSLEMIERFIKDIYGIKNFFRIPLSGRFSSLEPLKKIHTAVFTKWQRDQAVLEAGPHTSIFPLADCIKWFSKDEFENSILPFIEAAFFWEKNKELGLTTVAFRRLISQRIGQGDQSALYGHLSEIYMSGLYIYDGWKNILYADKKTKKRRLDF